MAHIANKIDAKDKKLQEIFYGNRYKIDVFQREYRWKREQIEALISDLSSSFFNSYNEGDDIETATTYDCYYMGPIVLCEDLNELSIVDGQQRLTSFTLLFIFLNHLQNSLEINDDLKLNLSDYIFVKKAGKKTLVININKRNNLIEELYETPNHLYIKSDKNSSEENLDEDINEESLENIKGRYEDIVRFFPPELTSEFILPIFIEWLLHRVVVVEIKAYNLDNAYTIFETMNDRGLSLNPTEILKAYLLSNIKDEKLSEEANEIWKELIATIQKAIGQDSDLDFFRAWFRGKYALTKRGTHKGAENEDFEKMGVQFHSWIKTNAKRIYLKQPKDYYHFIISDFRFYAENYLKLYGLKNQSTEQYEEFNIVNFYAIADSLVYPLFLAPILKTDLTDLIEEKFKLINHFLDRYTNIRMLTGKPITQSSIRSYFYELIKSIRDKNKIELKNILEIENMKLNELYIQNSYRKMDNWGYYHYFYARIIYHLCKEEYSFGELIRSRKQSSFVLIQIFPDDDIEDENMQELLTNSLGNFCLIRRYDIDTFSNKKGFNNKIKYLLKNGYLPEYSDIENNDVIEFITKRNRIINELLENIWIN
ncbi:DUF262 domain-containing protein [uncultured Bacteroides sp.]|uniref:DUF262 domain-containing protein n=1 Tax=uncultured Bacteroides sp. TaxID=162156 RepID=UPI002AABD8FF|nr:DUF262 domain-containing protein [uncultured Bacteroides sp.]